MSSLLLLALAGCRTHPPMAYFPSTVATRPSETSDVFSRRRASDGLSPPSFANGGTSGAYPPSEAGQPVRLASLESDMAPEEIGPLSLERAIDLALERNPDLATVRAREPVAHAAFHVAETYPWNPQFQTQVLPYSRDRNGNDGAVSQQHVIVQTFELGGQRRFRRGAAAANWVQVMGTIRHAELISAAQTTRLYFAALYRRELRNMNQLLADLNEQLVGIMQRRQKAGQANSTDVQLARLQAQSSRRQQRLAEASYLSAIMNLQKQLNLDANAPLELEDQWVDWRWRSLDEVLVSSSEHLSVETTGDGPQPVSGEIGASVLQVDDATLRQLVLKRPDLVAARAAAAAASENLRLANAARRPNLQIGPMYQRDDASTEFWGVQGQIDIPVVNTGKPLVAQRFAELRQQRITAAQLENRAVLEAGAAIWRYERARRLVEESRYEFARAISDALKPFDDQFKAGQITLLQVFAARASLAQSRQSFLDLLNELAMAAADVTQATGIPPQLLFASAKSRASEDTREIPSP